MIKNILKVIFLLLVISLLILSGLYFIPPSQEVIEYDYAELENDSLLNSKVGWYLADNGQEYQITWGAKKGLQLNHFDSLRSNLKNIRLRQIDNNQFDTDGNLASAEVIFNVDSNLMIEVATSKTNFNAVKKDSLYYEQEEIEYANENVKLAGLLMTPINDKKLTAIVFIHGSGVSDRDNFWYMYQADYLARNGYMVFLPDKRGCGKSKGEWHKASFADFANDTGAAIDYLLKHKASEFSKIGVLGLSQGSWISHTVNQEFENLDFIIDVVGSATVPNEQVKFEIMNDIKNSGAPGFLANPLSLVFAKRAMGKRKEWWDKNGNYNPIPYIRESKIPILKILAENDRNVPVTKTLDLLEEMMLSESSVPITIKTFQGSGHALFDQDTEWIRNDYLNYVVDWASK